MRRAARELTGADGATFVLREDDRCHYVDEDAVAPLWKGRRFPLSACISGWTMLHREAVALEDIYADPRIPHDAYRATFVKSLVMVPIRREDPVGAIGTYWAAPHRAGPGEVRLLQALADATSVAMESVRLYAELEARVRARTAELAEANSELEAFAATASHDLRTPLRAIDGFARILIEDFAGPLGPEGRRHLESVARNAVRMSGLIDALLAFSRARHAPLRSEVVDLSALAREVGGELAAAHPDRTVDLRVEDGLEARGDPVLLRNLLENLLGNAWKFTGKVERPRVDVGAVRGEGALEFFVRDNGAGFDAADAEALFRPFHRMHAPGAFPGHGVGLATVRRIAERHGGRVRAEGAPGRGATLRWTLGGREEGGT